MDIWLIVTIDLICLVVLLLAAVPVAISLAVSGILGVILLESFTIATNVMAGTTYSAVAKESLLIIPMFILMGMMTLYSGIAPQLFAIGARVLRWLPGGLAIATVFASAGFGAISGSSLATIATLGKTSISEMVRHGYHRGFAASTVAVAGTLSVLIPPSIILVFYGILTGESIGELLIAGIIPGGLSALFIAAFIVVRVLRNPSLVDLARRTTASEVALSSSNPSRADRAAVRLAVHDREALSEISDESVSLTFSSGFKAMLGIAVLFTVVVGGIYTGVFTPTESASIGAVAATLLLAVHYFRKPKELGFKIRDALYETATTSGMIFMIVIGAGFFSYFLVAAGVPSAITTFALSLNLPPTLIVIMLLLVLIPAGMFLDSMSLLIITVPLLYAPITGLGFNGIWLGILVVKLIELGMLTPPVGMNAFVTAGSFKSLKVEQVFRGITPFFIAELLLIVTLFIFPALSTWLPSLSNA